MRVARRKIAVASGLADSYGSQRRAGMSVTVLPPWRRWHHSASGLVRSGANRQLMPMIAIASPAWPDDPRAASSPA